MAGASVPWPAVATPLTLGPIAYAAGRWRVAYPVAEALAAPRGFVFGSPRMSPWGSALRGYHLGRRAAGHRHADS